MREYEELIDAFCNLNNEAKRDEIMYEVQELFALFHSLNSGNNTLFHTEMNDYEQHVGEDEFLNAVYAYLISTKESIGQYLDNK